MLDTTELRWFVEGPPPSQLSRWFDARGPTVVEERSDAYRVDGRHDVGVKLRSGQTLEVKVRHRLGPRMRLEHGPHGVPEVWRKWTFGASRTAVDGGECWVAVDKTIAKRRFSLDGEPIGLLDGAQTPTVAACDVEVAQVIVDGNTAWTFAFAAYGPVRSRVPSIVASWSSIRPDERPPADPLILRGSFGYAEWLERRLLARSGHE